MIKFLYMTNDPDVAEIAEKNGVDRIWVDLEMNGKEARQKGTGSVISHHTLQDVCKIRERISTSELLVRINPWFEGSKKEIDDVIKAGADRIMLPMWKTADEVKNFVEAVGGRVKTVLLLETKEAAESALDEVLDLNLAEEIHVGLRDLSLSYDIDFLFSIYEKDILEMISQKIHRKPVPFGIGGVGKFGMGFSPGPERLLIENIRLGASSIILSRTFCDSSSYEKLSDIDNAFKYGIREFRKWERIAGRMSNEMLEYNRKELIFELEGAE